MENFARDSGSELTFYKALSRIQSGVTEALLPLQAHRPLSPLETLLDICSRMPSEESPGVYAVLSLSQSAFCCWDKIRGESNRKRRFCFGSRFWKFQSAVIWLYYLWPVVKWSIVGRNTWLSQAAHLRVSGCGDMEIERGW